MPDSLSYSDQPSWGRMMHQHGVGANPLSNKNLSADLLASTIGQVVNDPEMQRKATLLGDKIRTEDGIGNAVDVIKRVLA